MTDKQIIIDAFNSAWNRKVATENSYGKLASKEVFENNNEDKQIIINGCDVSGCKWYTQGATGMICADWHISNDCCRNYNCYYKQLKRKEQIIEKLKEKHNAICESCPRSISCDECSNNTTLKILNGEIV